MKIGWVGGVYVERDKVTLTIAQSNERVPYPTLEFETISDERHWNPNDRNDALTQLSDLARDIVSKFPDLRSLAIAGYGPFTSLSPGSNNYGEVHSNSADQPFCGVNLASIFREAFLERGHIAPLISVHTDASAIAIGEAMARNIKQDEVLIAILVTEGVGGGIVVGREITKGALHPEIGLIHPRFHEKDPLRPKLGARLYSKSIGELASNKAMRKRYKQIIGTEAESDEQILNHSDRNLWDYRAYYIAQVCLAATAFLAPHKIVIATDFGRLDSLVRDTRAHLEDFWHTRKNDSTPLPSYDALVPWEEYISGIGTYPIPSLEGDILTIGLTGAAGMSLQAARNPYSGLADLTKRKP